MGETINAVALNEAEGFKAPTVGRIVHYFPNDGDKHCEKNGAEVVPAIVVQVFGRTVANLSVFPMNPDGTNVIRYSVQHRSQVNNEGIPYWDWPMIN